MDSNGWVKWDEVRTNCEFLRFKPKDDNSVTDDWIRRMADSTKKQRFDFDPPEYGSTIIRVRARQGHTLNFVNNETICQRITALNMPDTAIHTTYPRCVQSILKTGIQPGGLAGGRNEVLSQAYHNDHPNLESSGRKEAPIGVEWDIRKMIVDGWHCGLTGQGAISTMSTIRRMYIMRIFHTRRNCSVRKEDIIWERRNDCDKALRDNSTAGPYDIGNFVCTEPRDEYEDYNVPCGGLCFWGTITCQTCQKSVVSRYTGFGLRYLDDSTYLGATGVTKVAIQKARAALANPRHTGKVK
jgi:RNA:NAD 2'-phosphotransferase (TPT1/KptA family)